MRVLHIANDFFGSKVHRNLFVQMDLAGVEQTVFDPVRSEEHVGKNVFEAEHTEFRFANVIKPYHKVLYHLKANAVYKALLSSVDPAGYDLVHASTMFSDGIIANRIYRRYGIPYVVAVRATDIYDFIGRKLFHTWPDGWRILLDAKKIYFISAAGQKVFCQTAFVRPILDRIKDKFVLRPNGIEDVWIDNVYRIPHSSRKVCYVGTFLKRKNLDVVIEAVKLLRGQQGTADISLRVIGGGGDANSQMLSLIEANKDFVEYLGIIKDKQQLMKYLRDSAMFVMPSESETFGLVYIEALSQNLPLVYTKNDGIDGLFDERVGVAVSPRSVSEVAEAIKRIADSSQSYGNNGVDFSVFRWSEIASKYISDYRGILQECDS